MLNLLIIVVLLYIYLTANPTIIQCNKFSIGGNFCGIHSFITNHEKIFKRDILIYVRLCIKQFCKTTIVSNSSAVVKNGF